MNIKFINYGEFDPGSRMNASGRLNTCKSNGKVLFGGDTSGARVSNAYTNIPISGGYALETKYNTP